MAESARRLRGRYWLGAVLIVVVLAVLAAAGFGVSRAMTPVPIHQPIDFNHKLHLQQGLSCINCHSGVETGPYATLPLIRACLLCHQEQQGNNPNEKLIRVYAKKHERIPWIQVNRLPGHVYFSHVAHVRFAKMDCSQCHGDMKDRETSVTRSQIGALDMDRCMQCHEEHGVSNDCMQCHK